MKVFDLGCEQGHRFEGWFASGDSCDQQQARGLLTCPVCDSTAVRRLPSAPRLNLGASPPSRHGQSGEGGGGHKAGAQQSANALRQTRRGSDGATADAQQQAWQAALMQAVREVVQRTEDVGPRFAEEARRMHYAETPERPIRGQATLQEAQELREEGIDVVTLPALPALRGPLQ